MLLLVSALLLQDPRDRLQEAVRESRLEDARSALREMAAGDGARAARGLIAALPRARDRMASLLKGSVGARADYNRIDSSFSFGLEEERLKNRSLEKAKEQIQEANARAAAGELVYDAIRGAFASLKPEAVPVLAEEAGRTASWILKCELVEGLGALGAEKPLLALLAREKEPVALAAILHAGASERGAAFFKDPHWQVRLGALRSVAASRERVESVIEALPAADARWRNAAFEGLRALTKTDLPPDPDVWQDWWKANGADFLEGRYNPARPRELEGPHRTTFYGIPIRSSRVCFIIDRSRSMAEQDRFAAAVKELKRLIEELPDGALVNILFFGETVTAFAAATRPLDKSVRRDLGAFIDKQRYESGTDLYRALEKGLTLVGSAETGTLREDGVDTLVVLSDGQATVGRLVDDDLVGRVIARRARYLRPVIHTVSLVNDARSLKLLSDLTGGEYRRP